MNANKSIVALLAVAGIALWTPAAHAIITGGGCVDDQSGQSNNCTANDVTFVVVGLGVETDGCVNAGDTVSIYLQGTVQNTTAQTRYDIGLWVATDGDPNGDGALSGTCARESLQPVGTAGVTTCGPSALDLLRQYPLASPDNGPYLNVDGDNCGDLYSQGNSGCDENGDGLWDDSIIRFTTPLTFPCDDANSNGFVEIPTCATWGNQNNQVGGTSCDSEAELVPGTKAKCNCAVIDSTIPTPDLGMSCSQSPTTLDTDQTGSFTVTFANNRTCTPDTSLPERDQCGSGSYIWYEVDYDQSQGNVSSISCTTGTCTDDGDRIIWIPDSSMGTAGVISQGETGTLTYDYTYTGATMGGTVSTGTYSYWTNSATDVGDRTASGVTEQSTLGCNLSTGTTPVTVASFRSDHKAGGLDLSWSTETETANAGFNVYGETPTGWKKLNRSPIPSTVVDSTEPQSYSFDAKGSGAKRLMVEDLAADGKTRIHGPFEVGKAYGAKPAGKPIDWQAIRDQDTPRLAAKAGQGGQGGGKTAATSARLLVDHDGLYRVTYEDLVAAGLDLSSVPTSHLALLHHGQAVPIRVVGKGKLGPGSYVEFLGQGLDTLYTDTDVYTLTDDVHDALRIPEVSATPGSAAVAAAYTEDRKVERNRQYSPASPGDDPWIDTRMTAFTSPESWSFDLDADGYQAGAGPVDLAVELWGVTAWPQEPDHHVVARVNGVEVGEARFDAQEAYTLRVQVPTGVLTPGTNALTLELPGDTGVRYDIVDLESYDLTYPRSFTAEGGALDFRAVGGSFAVSDLPSADAMVYRVTAAGPELLSGVQAEGSGSSWTLRFAGTSSPADYRVAAASALSAPDIEPAPAPVDIDSGQAQYLVISHPAFLGHLAPLVADREAQGLSVKVVNVDDVYDEYSYGVFDPQAIHDYITHAAQQMGTEYVLLVGGDTYDYRDYLGTGSVSFIPSLYAPTGSLIRFAPVDPLYADVDGDGVPDVALGRLPVRTGAELDSVIAKILAYERGSYTDSALVAADAVDPAAGTAFSQDGEAIIRDLPSGWTVHRAYIDNLGEAGARERLLDTLGSGVGLTAFVGHSGLTTWTFSGLFRASDVATLGNVGKPTVVLQWGCWNTYYVDPVRETLGHDLILTPDRGAAAVLGATTLLETSSARALNDHLAPLIGRPGMTLGEAVTTAKQELVQAQSQDQNGAHPDLSDVILGWTILGDPAMAVSH